MQVVYGNNDDNPFFPSKKNLRFSNLSVEYYLIRENQYSNDGFRKILICDIVFLMLVKRLVSPVYEKVMWHNDLYGNFTGKTAVKYYLLYEKRKTKTAHDIILKKKFYFIKLVQRAHRIAFLRVTT